MFEYCQLFKATQAGPCLEGHLWPLLFAVGIVQGIFLAIVFAVRKSDNLPATRLLQALLALFVLSNFDDLWLAAGWYQAAPRLFGFSMGAMFAYGPLFFLYIAAVTKASFSWKRTYWRHFLPAALGFLMNFSWLRLPAAAKAGVLRDFLDGRLPVRPFDAILSTLQALHFAIYIYLAYRLVRRSKASPEASSLQVPIQSRAGWLNTLVVLFSLILLAMAVLLAWNLSRAYYAAGANFVFTLITSSILYFIAYKLMLRPELVTPGFSRKYESVRFEDGEEQDLLLQLQRCMAEEKAFSDPSLKLDALAQKLNTSPHRLSKLINDHYGRSFSDFVNQHRADAFIRLLNDPSYANYTLYGLALEVGFNSKSAFNAAFKKIKGMPPSAFKKRRPVL